VKSEIKRRHCYGILLVLLCFGTSSGQGPKWLYEVNQIVPLDTKQADVERILRINERTITHPPGTYYVLARYETKLGTWYVRYSTGECLEGQTDGYNVGKGTVVDALVGVRPRIKVETEKWTLQNSRGSTRRTLP
jgi:hypothetical protein